MHRVTCEGQVATFTTEEAVNRIISFLKGMPTSLVGMQYSVLTEEISSLVHTDETQTVEHITIQHT